MPSPLLLQRKYSKSARFWRWRRYLALALAGVLLAYVTVRAFNVAGSLDEPRDRGGVGDDRPDRNASNAAEEAGRTKAISSLVPIVSECVRTKSGGDPPRSVASSTELVQHYRDLLNFTSRFRVMERTTTPSLIEDAFISRFCCNRSLDAFGGLIPIFARWTSKSAPQEKDEESIMTILPKLRNDVVYITVSSVETDKLPSNVVVMSDRRFLNRGQIPLPFIVSSANDAVLQGVQNATTNRGKESTYRASLVARDLEHPAVRAATETGKRVLGNAFVVSQLDAKDDDCPLSKETIEITRKSATNLVVSGDSAASQRLSEIVRMGMVPVHIWSDEDEKRRVPYRGSRAAPEFIGFSLNVTSLETFLRTLLPGNKVEEDTTQRKLRERERRVRQVRNTHYTLDGMLKQIETFFVGGGGDLGCVAPR